MARAGPPPQASGARSPRGRLSQWGTCLRHPGSPGFPRRRPSAGQTLTLEKGRWVDSLPLWKGIVSGAARAEPKLLRGGGNGISSPQRCRIDGCHLVPSTLKKIRDRGSPSGAGARGRGERQEELVPSPCSASEQWAADRVLRRINERTQGSKVPTCTSERCHGRFCSETNRRWGTLSAFFFSGQGWVTCCGLTSVPDIV